MQKGEDKGVRIGTQGRKKILFFILPLFFLFLSFIGFFFLFQTPTFINGLGAVLGDYFGYRVKVKNLSLSPKLKGEILDLQISGVKDRSLSFLCSHVSINSNVRKSLKGEIESIILSEPKLSFRFGEKKKKIDLSFLKKLPSVHLLTLQKGEFELSFASYPYIIKLTDLTLDMKDFSPRRGGMITFYGLLNISSGDKIEAEGVGWCKGYLNLTSLLPIPTGRGLVEFHIDSGYYRSTSFRNLILKFPVNLEKEKVDIDSISLALDSLTYRRGGKDTTLRELRFQTSVLYDLNSSTINSTIKEGRIVNLGDFKGSFRITLHGEFPWNASIEAQSIDFTEVFAIFKPLLPGEYQRWSIQGKGAMETHFEGNYSGERLDWAGDVILHFQKGGFSSPDGTKAGQGIGGKVIMKLKSPSSEKKVSFDISSEVGGWEFLWGKYYRDFSRERVSFSSQGNFFLSTIYPLEFQGAMDFFGTGKFSFAGLIQKDESLLYFKAERVSHPKVLSVLLRDYISQNFSSLADLQIDGDSHIEIKSVVKGKNLYLDGIMKINDTSVQIPSIFFSLNQLNLTLPFDLSYFTSTNPPREEKEKRAGFLHIKSLRKDRVTLEDLNIPLILSQNTLLIPEVISISLFGGKIVVFHLKGAELLLPSRRFDFGIKLENIDLSSLTQNVTSMDFPGILEADFPVIRYQGGEWTARGRAVAKIFGGEVEATNLSARNLFSRDRRIGGDIYFKGINLEKVTEKMKTGKVTGVIQGSLRNLEIEYGQPSRFILDVDSVKTRSVKQRVSVDAIKNISILGTGSEGIAGILSRGINKFFEEYPYSHIGIRCTLENDSFSLRGKIHEGSTEYLVRRAFLRGIDVINQNPQNTISFKDMQERIRRIFSPREGPIFTKE